MYVRGGRGMKFYWIHFFKDFCIYLERERVCIRGGCEDVEGKGENPQADSTMSREPPWSSLSQP